MLPVSSKNLRGHVLVVDDDELFRESLGTNLTDIGFSTHCFSSGQEIIGYLTKSPNADLILLDWKMPGMTGIEVLQYMRTKKIDIPVIFLTVLGAQIYEEAGLLGGAVDFVEKSRSFSILLRRIELILSGQKPRKGTQHSVNAESSIQRGSLTLRLDSRRASWGGADILLTLTEFNILVTLTERLNRDVSYREIYDIVRGEGFVAGEGEVGYRTNVRAFIKRIRQKFRDVDPNFAQIENYPGFGYRWVDGSGQ